MDDYYYQKRTAKNIFTGYFHGHHPSDVNKTGNISGLMTTTQKSKKKRVIMMHNLCHHWYNTFLEEGNYQLDTLGNWKSSLSRLRQFLVQKEQCNGILGKFILGFDKDGVMELLENVSKIR